VASSPSDPSAPGTVDDSGIADAGSLLRRVAELYPDREAFVDGSVRLTFAAWDRAADAVAGFFARLGVVKGDVVSLVLPSSADYAICYQAAMRLGAITSGINPRPGPRDFVSILDRTRPRVTVVDATVATLPEGAAAGTIVPRDTLGTTIAQNAHGVAFPDVGLDDPVAIVWTSGTTGVPKGAVFDHGCLKAMVQGAGVLSHPGDRRLSPLPFAHVGYMTRPWDELVHVITTVILPTPWKAAEHLRLIEAERITVAQGVPTQWQLVLAHPDLPSTDTSTLRITSSGAARVPAELVEQLRAAFGVPVVVRYTSTEACISTGTTVEDDADVIATTVGRPSAGVELRIVADGRTVAAGEVGEVLLRSRAAMRRYWQDPERTADMIDHDGWVHTGDLGSLDANGNLKLAGRRTEMYIRGGYNVYPAEVEAVLGEHPAVDRVAVVGVADPVLGQVGVAAVVVAPGVPVPGVEDLRGWCRDRLANYKTPDRIEFVDDLPLTAMLKVDKRVLEERFGKESG
jgi:acyl-CoA synthetase (AMP-forming)/AMP-acid ligase II